MSGSRRSPLAVTGVPARPLAWLVVPFMALLSVALPVFAAPARAATPGSITLKVASARTNADTNQNPDNLPIVHKGDPVSTYKWLITVDDVGNPESKSDASLNACLPYGKSGQVPTDLAPQSAYNPGDGTKAGASAAGVCQWPSTRTTPGALDVVASGDQTDLNGTKALQLPAGKYLISVTADNFKIDGQHFTVADGKDGQVAVTMQPYPLPLGAVRYKIFADTVPVDGTYEADAEQGVGGFVGHITDVLGEVSTDFFGNRLCTNYQHRDHLAATDPNYTRPGDAPLAGYSRSNFDPYSPLLFDSTGAPMIDTNDPGGTCYSDRNGDIVMPNLGPDRYAASAVAPTGQQWYQTNTLEGSHDWDIWMAEGETGYDNEMTVGAEKVSNTQLGFVPWGYNLDANNNRTGPKSITVTTASATASTGGLRTVTLGLTPTNPTTIPARQTIRLNRTILLGSLLRPLIVPAGDYVVAQGGSASISFLLPSTSNATTAYPSAAVTATTITPPDAGPALFRANTGHTVSGTVVMLNAYIGGTGGVTVPETQWAGASVKGPIKQPIVTLSDLGGNDQMVQVARWGDNGQFSIQNVPDGSYQLTFWDFEQDTIIDSVNVVVKGGDVNVGQKGLVGWWTEVRGSVFVDANGNGRRDPGEAGVPQFLLTFKERDNSMWDQGINSVTTDKNGDYVIREAYPVTKWSILEAFNTRYHTTGVTVQADNETSPTTYLGAAVDINVLPIIGLGGRVDWGVKPYAGSENGGIAGTVTYDTTRNELDPADAVTEPYQPGIPDLPVHLYYPLRDANGDLVQNKDGSVAVVKGADGNPLKVQDDYISETWEAPKDCVARDYKGNPLTTGKDQLALPPAGSHFQCVEAPMTGFQAVPSDTTPGNFGQTVNGNYAFADMNYDPDALAAEATRQGEALKNGDDTQAAAGNTLTALTDPVPLPNGDDFVVKVDSIKDSTGKDIYKPTREEDVNVFDGDVRMPQENYPLPASDVQPGAVTDPNPGQGGPISQTPGIVSACAGANHTVHVTSQGFKDAGGSPYEGQDRPLCDAKVVTIRANQTVAPNFNFFTDVPLPTHFWGLTINDLGLTHDKQSIGYGEAQGLPNVPMGIYDWSGQLVDTVRTDYNGMYEATEPSTSSYNCPLPAGPCPGMYYFKGNDPGVPGRPNADYNPRFRTIGTNFQAWPGLYTVTDTAPTQVAQVVLQPGADQVGNPVCDVSGDTPNIMAVSTPYIRSQTSTSTNNTSHQTQTLAVNNIRISGAGTTRSVTISGAGNLDVNGLPPAVSLPTLDGTNASGLSAAQRSAINANTTHPVTAITPTSITFTLTGASLLLPNTAGVNGVAANFTATVNGYTGATLVYHPAQTVTATKIAIAGTLAKTVTLTIPTNDVDVRPLPSTVVLPAVNATNASGLTTAQRTALNTLGTAVAGGEQYTVNAETTGSITFGILPLVANTTTDATANLPVTLPPFQVPAPAPATGQEVVIKGSGFGATTGQVTLTPSTGTSNAVASPTSWTDTEIHVLVGAPNGAAPTPGAYQLGIRNADSKKDAVNGLTFHILGTGYNPTLIQVNPPAAYAGNSTAANTFMPKPADTDLLANPETAIQAALDRAANPLVNSLSGGALVVVWPGVVTTWSPTGDYFENLIVHSNVKIQGVGPGGFQGQTYVPGTRINGLGFQPDNPQGANWIATLQGLGVDPETIPDGAVVTVLGDGTFDRSYKAAIDGATITGGAQQGFGTNVNVVSGGNRTPVGGAGALVTQGGGVFLNTQADGMQISNNLIVGNSGTYGGAIRIGTPYTAVQAANGSWSVPTTVRNTGVRILHNRMRDNGGTNLAGGVGIFDGSDGYVVDHNDLCGNFSAEYGGGLSHYGLSDGGKISFNRIYLNGSYDEGGGVMIAGELNPNVNQPSAGAAHSTSSLTIDANTVERNLANDDGGGIRFLQAGTVPISVTNNFVNDNISTHEGGGFALDDSTKVSIIGNTVMRNITTATAATSDGKPAPAGLSVAANSDQLQATLGTPSATNPIPLYSKPVLKSNLFAGNLAGTWNGGTQKVTGITAADAFPWDAGSIEPLQADNGSGTPIASPLAWSSSYWQANADPSTQLSPAPSAADTTTPAVVKAYDVSVVIEANRAFPNFRQAVMVANVVAPDVTGDYHLTAANGHGGPATDFPLVSVFPSTTGTRHDIDNQPRPVTTGTANADAGADQVG